MGPTVTFVRWEPARQMDVFRVTAQSTGKEVEGAGRIVFYRHGRAALWFSYPEETPCREVADRFTAALTVVPEQRVPPAEERGGAKAEAAVIAAAAALLVGWRVWRGRRS